ncbi:DCC1-like thiol-disulfide oxidoreductase family protein [Soonwooa sp.]|uniref:thiol-disulfide oxidoreductase DCC family protein n=1 Tax=Soonwooa sp. TaxID=1938592 RepID=UPI00261013F4|nr:DCC1-like thiol-disulfide oxidoreductase family protein [Soonwooa sp.]
MENFDADYQNKYIVFYDGDCGFCNFWVQWILDRDKKDQFLFAALQSNLGQKFLKERHQNFQDFDSIFLWKPTSFYLKKSDAAIKIAQILGGLYRTAIVGKLLPHFVRDFMYDQVAKRRKKLMSLHCRIPTENDRKKFIND